MSNASNVKKKYDSRKLQTVRDGSRLKNSPEIHRSVGFFPRHLVIFFKQSEFFFKLIDFSEEGKTKEIESYPVNKTPGHAYIPPLHFLRSALMTFDGKLQVRAMHELDRGQMVWGDWSEHSRALVTDRGAYRSAVPAKHIWVLMHGLRGDTDDMKYLASAISSR